MEEAGHWDEKEMSRRWLLGDECFMAVDDGRCVHYSWMSKRALNISEVGYLGDLSAGSHWIYNSYTSPSHRGRSIFPRALQKMTEAALAQDGGIVWAGVRDTNASSVRGLCRAGFKEAFVMEEKTFLSSMKTLRSRTVIDPLLALRFDASSFPREKASKYHGY